MTNMLTEIVTTTMNLLEYDDLSPTIHGLNYRTAVEKSIQILQEETAKYGMTFEVQQDTIESAVKEVLSKRITRRL